MKELRGRDSSPGKPLTSRQAKEIFKGVAHSTALTMEIPDLWVIVAGAALTSPEAFEDSILYLNGVTASGQEEEKLLADFRKELTPEIASCCGRVSVLVRAPGHTDPPERSVKHHIYVAPDSVPASRRAYPLGERKLKAMRDQMTELIEKGWVTPSTSPWAAPILFVPKGDGTQLRMCVDFRDLNALTKKDAFPLPRLDLLLHKAQRAKVFTNLDLASGFHQVEVNPKHRELTAFILPEPVGGSALWEWKVMPFGLVNAPPTFQRAMTVALRGCEEFSVVYIDDVLVFSETPEQHLQSPPVGIHLSSEARLPCEVGKMQVHVRKGGIFGTCAHVRRNRAVRKQGGGFGGIHSPVYDGETGAVLPGSGNVV